MPTFDQSRKHFAPYGFTCVRWTATVMPRSDRHNEIETGVIQEGYLPRTARTLVEQWRQLHLAALRDDWNRARQRLPLLPIPPLE